jgi:hypothetical protein
MVDYIWVRGVAQVVEHLPSKREAQYHQNKCIYD